MYRSFVTAVSQSSSVEKLPSLAVLTLATELKTMVVLQRNFCPRKTSPKGSRQKTKKSAKLRTLAEQGGRGLTGRSCVRT